MARSDATTISGPECHGPCALVMGDSIYPNRPKLAAKAYWVCSTCKARVGCHPGTTKPLGTPADSSTRAARARAHSALDPLWRSGWMTRSDAYAWAGKTLDVHPFHVGTLNREQCEDLVLACLRFTAGQP
jgi:hypothetical protein